MKTRLLPWIWLLLGCLVLTPLAYAEVLEGTVSAVDSSSSVLVIHYSDPISGDSIETKVTVPEEAILSGVTSIDEIQVGQDVTVTASLDETTGIWTASDVEVV